VAPGGGPLTNTASAGSPVADPNLLNNTNAAVTGVVLGAADVAIFKAGPAVGIAGSNLVYTITATNSGPSSAVNVVVQDNLPSNVIFQGASGGGSLSGNLVVWPAMILTNGATTNFTVSITAPSSGSFTNIAFSTSVTPDPNTNNNNGTLPGSRVTTSVVTNIADVSITVSGPPIITVGDGFFYMLTVSNGGPSTAVNTLVTNLLPTNVAFASASGGGVNTNNIVTWPVIPSLTNGQSTNLIVTVTPSTLGSTNLFSTYDTNHPFSFDETNTASGFLTNLASAFAATLDTNLVNNSASSAYTNAQVQTVIVPGMFSIFISTNTYPTNGLQGVVNNRIYAIGANLFIVGTSAYNPQTDLYEETVSVTNIGTVAVHALRLYVNGPGGIPVPLRSGVTLNNATGTDTNGQYVEYDPPYNSPLTTNPPNNFVTFQLEFYVANRLPFTNSLTAVAILAPTIAPLNETGVSVHGSFVYNVPNDPRFLIQITNTIPGRTYTIEYSTNMASPWIVVVPSIVASANSTFWYDDGPPATLSKPSLGGGMRMYQVILDP
jgi:uncharacterized repeat protein (TIGR01451 family)